MIFVLKYKAIIFDAYGTLLDTGNGSIKATATILKTNGENIDAKSFYQRWKIIHRENINNVTSFIKEEEIFLMDLKRLYQEYNIHGNPESDVNIMLNTLGKRTVYPDTLEVLNKLKTECKLYIGSISDHTPLLADVKRNRIEVDNYFSSESLKVYKPRKEFYIRILNKIGMLPKDILFVGDSEIDDVLGPISIGMDAIWLNRKALKNEENKGTYIQINDLYQLICILGH
jgi:2-haloalkanoic acid dehalogenase type II